MGWGVGGGGGGGGAIREEAAYIRINMVCIFDTSSFKAHP